MSFARGLVHTSAPGGRPATWAATGRSGGSSAAPFDTLNLAGYVGDDPAAVDANRCAVAVELGLAPDRWCVMHSVHGADVSVVDAPGVVTGVDALITQVPGLALIALAADCVPLALVGTDGQTVAAVHCGWRGLVVDVVGATVRAMRALGTDISGVVVGPAVCGRCYPVPVERCAEIVARTSVAVGSAACVVTADGQPGVDVRRGVRARLGELGIDPACVESVAGCTVEEPGLFSYRRDGVTGRQGIAVARLAQ